MSNNIAQDPFAGFPPELRPEALADFPLFYRELLIEGWAAKRELADLKRLRDGHREWAMAQLDKRVELEREQALSGWSGIWQQEE